MLHILSYINAVKCVGAKHEPDLISLTGTKCLYKSRCSKTDYRHVNIGQRKCNKDLTLCERTLFVILSMS